MYKYMIEKENDIPSIYANPPIINYNHSRKPKPLPVPKNKRKCKTSENTKKYDLVYSIICFVIVFLLGYLNHSMAA